MPVLCMHKLARNFRAMTLVLHLDISIAAFKESIRLVRAHEKKLRRAPSRHLDDDDDVVVAVTSAQCVVA